MLSSKRVLLHFIRALRLFRVIIPYFLVRASDMRKVKKGYGLYALVSLQTNSSKKKMFALEKKNAVLRAEIVK